jgi:hypothetical protein
MATATAPTLPAATPSILAIDVLRREGSDRDA